MKFEYSKSNVVKGAFIYAAGDTVATLIQGQLDWRRVLGFFILGATLYAFEIPNWFRFIDEKTAQIEGHKAAIAKTLMAMAFFNPLWIARHLFFIALFSGKIHDVSLDIFRVSGLSFLMNIPIAIVANFAIQNAVKLEWRFLFSALFSALMAVYYALSASWFA